MSNENSSSELLRQRVVAVRTRRWRRAATSLLAVIAMPIATMLTLLSPASAAAQPETAAPAVVIAPADLGTSAETAAGSCWEIKQQDPSAGDGAYWLLTPKMSAPQQFYCDMTTDGGGWVLIAKGRNGWTKNVGALGRASDLLTPGLATMSAATSQYSATTVDQILDGTRVDALADGVRLRRARNTTGTTWQEVRMKFAKFGHWAWAFGALYPVTNWSFDGAVGSGGTSQNFGSDSSYRRVTDVPASGNGWNYGFAYGSGVTGSSASTSYLWSPNGGGGAIPFTDVYLRPHVTSDDPGFTPIADGGTAAQTEPKVAESDALSSPWGVAGLPGVTSVEGDVEVQAFTQSGNTMYVGGNFEYVQRDAAGTGRVQQPFLAAFDVDTGQFVSSFRPVLNEQVHALATLPNGDVVAGGLFTRANGQPATEVVALNPTTGATDPDWSLTVENRKSAGVVNVRALKVIGGDLYLGGDFTHLSGGPARQTVYASNIGRVDAASATPSAPWSGGLLNGGVNDLSGGTLAGKPDRVYAAGFFTQSGSTPTLHAAAFETSAGAPLATPAWNPTWSNSNSYQRAVDATGAKVWVGGSEHSLFQFDPSTFNRTLGDIMYDKGDIQVISDDDGTVYAGCHCNYYDYANDYAWPTLTPDWTRADGMNWIGAWDGATGNRVPQFAPELKSRLGSGVWAIRSDSTDTLWVGGDLTAATTAAKRGAWAGGFARFAAADSSAPPTPTGFHVVSKTSTTVTLGWNRVSDPSGVSYQVLRDDRPIASTGAASVTVPTSTAGRFFLRAADTAGNVSASSRVLVVGTGTVPPTPSFTWSARHSTVSVDASGSTSPNGPITDYLWDFGDGSGAHGASYSHTYTAAGSYPVSLTVTDGQGATATTTRSVSVGAPPVNAAPDDVYGRQVYSDDPGAYYRLGEPGAGSGAHDSGPDGRDGSYQDGNRIAFGTAGALKSSTDTAITTDGAHGSVSFPHSDTAPGTFSTEIWFSTTSNRGGRLIGFGNSSTGDSSSYDRHLYLRNDGRLVFGAYPSREVEVVSPGSYNDGQWHMAVATMSPADGMALYVDGALVGSDPNGDAQDYTGNWKVGCDQVWDGASSDCLNGSLDEAAVFDHVLTPAQVEAEYVDGATVIGQPVNDPPTASFTSTVDSLNGSFDARGSTDGDGTIAGYHWDFGDGSTGTGQLIQHQFAAPGDYVVTLTVTDDGGAQDTVQQTVTATAPPVATTVVADDATWAYHYDDTEVPADWDTAGFDASTWDTGAAPLGFGDSSVHTDLNTFSSPSQRPLAAYFTHRFQIADVSKVSKLVLDTVADDGVVVYVNGTEVDRANMPSGPVTSGTYASAPVRTAGAQQLSIVVPKNLLVNGTNVIAAETHLNYHATADMTFQLSATLTTGGHDQPPVADFTTSTNELAASFDASPSHDPDGTIASYRWDFGDGTTGTGKTVAHTYAQAGSYPVALAVMDDDGTVSTLTRSVTVTSPTSAVIPAGATWSYKYDAGAPPANWNTTGFDASVWNSGSAVLGFGDGSVVTDLDTFSSPSQRPTAAYFTHQFQIADASKVSKLVLDTVADDGVVVYVNGTEVDRTNMPTGPVTAGTFASTAVRTARAQHVSVDVPLGLLRNGTNVVAAETHLNYHATPDLTFGLTAMLTGTQ